MRPYRAVKVADDHARARPDGPCASHPFQLNSTTLFPFQLYVSIFEVSG